MFITDNRPDFKPLTYNTQRRKINLKNTSSQKDHLFYVVAVKVIHQMRHMTKGWHSLIYSLYNEF